MDIGMHGFVVGSKGDNRQQPTLLSERLAQRAKVGRQKLRLKEEIEALKMRVTCLSDEKGRAEGRVRRLKKETSAYTELSAELISRMHNFNTERTNLKEQKAALISKGQTLGKFRASVFLRKKQLISEILQIYPLSLVRTNLKKSYLIDLKLKLVEFVCRWRAP
jgi:chromosome segregation ATPase